MLILVCDDRGVLNVDGSMGQTPRNDEPPFSIGVAIALQVAPCELSTALNVALCVTPLSQNDEVGDFESLDLLDQNLVRAGSRWSVFWPIARFPESDWPMI